MKERTQTMSEIISVAIDGPSGAGKSTLARAAAGRLGYVYVDTGAIYRTIGYHILKAGIDPKNGAAVAAELPELRVEMRYGADGLQRMYLNGEDVTDAIRLPEVSRYASDVSAHPAVRDYLLEMQRQLAREHSVIMDGRDIGTVVLPQADLKIFLTASVEKRAIRRHKELVEKGEAPSLETIREQIAQRDWADTHRETAPLRQAEDAVVVDTSDLTLEESLAALRTLVKERLGL